MKKLTFIMAAIALVLGLGSCSEDRDPVYKAPTNFVLNAPAMQDQYIQLQEGNVLELVASQPDYGYAAVAQYSAQMSLTEDFADYRDLEATDGTATKARFVVDQAAVATAMCELLGIDSEDAYKEKFPNGMSEQKVYFRAVASLNGVEGSEITSNVVSYDRIVGYFAIPTPGYIYLVGSPEGWAGPTESNAAHYADWRLFEPQNGIGSKIYSGVFDIPAGSMFRFYTDLTGWDADSYGSQTDDNPVEFPELTGASESWSSIMVKGKGAYSFPNWEGGKMTITVDMSDMNNITVTILPGEHQIEATTYIYLIGALSGWAPPSPANESTLNPTRLACADGSGIYTAKYAVSAGSTNFKLATQLSDEDGGWGNPYFIGAAENDGDVDTPLTNGSYTGPYVSGKGNWKVEIPEDGFLNLTVDTNSKQITIVFSKD